MDIEPGLGPHAITIGNDYLFDVRLLIGNLVYIQQTNGNGVTAMVCLTRGAAEKLAAALKSAPAPEASEVTEAMVEAGAAKLAKCIAGVSGGAVAAQIYCAMEAARLAREGGSE